MSEIIEVDGRRIGRGERTFLIGEIGVNHNGDAGIARRLIDAAAELELDAVKFQSFAAERLVVKGTEMTGHQGGVEGVDADQFEQARSLELTPTEMSGLKDYAEAKGLVFISTPCDPVSARELGDMGMKVVKVASMDQIDALVLREVARMGVPVILSTGLGTLEETRRAIAFLEQEGARQIALLHCVAVYPAPPESLNLRFIGTLYDEFNRPVGFSDHTLGPDTAPLAVGAGACAIEKHFTLDRDMEGPDHKASLDPEGMRRMVASVRAAEVALGSTEKALSEAEKANAELMRKSLVFACDMPAGRVLAYEDIAAKRPASGISPMDYILFIGRVLTRNVMRDERIAEEHFEPPGR